MERSVLILVAQAVAAGALTSDVRLHAIALEGGGGGSGSLPIDPIMRALYLAKPVIEVSARYREARNQLGPSKYENYMQDGYMRSRTVYPDASQEEVERFRQVTYVADEVAGPLFVHLATAFPSDKYAKPQIMRVFDGELGHLDLLSASDLASLMSSTVPIAIVRELIHKHHMFFKMSNSSFSLFVEKYIALVLLDTTLAVRKLQ